MCQQPARVVQRGDSNVHYSVTRSALDIPASAERSEADLWYEIDAHQGVALLRKMLKGNPSLPVENYIPGLANENGWPRELIESVIRGHEPPVEPGPSLLSSLDDLRRLEFPALVDPTEPRQGERLSLEGRRYEPDRRRFGSLAELLGSVSLVHRLREVRWFEGFHRVKPAQGTMVPASIKKKKGWLPAYEVHGEGIFIQLNLHELREWERQLPSEVMEGAQALAARIEEEGLGFLRKPSPRFLMLHSLAHALIRQLCFACGYAASSLRERLYVDEAEMAGILIYTADGDSEGTLGGLVRQGQPDRLPQALDRALKDLEWCSADPLCIETEHQGLAGLNTAACHSCLLVSETACESANALLDRRLVIGDHGSIRGFFRRP